MTSAPQILAKVKSRTTESQWFLGNRIRKGAGGGRQIFLIISSLCYVII